MNMTFYGKSRVEHEREHHIHESPRSMTIPLLLLAAGSVLAGWVATPKLWNLPESFHAFERWLEPAFPVMQEAEHAASVEWTLMSLSVALALSGIWLARYFYLSRPDVPARMGAAFRPLYTLLYNKWTWTKSTISSSSTASARQEAACLAPSTVRSWMAA